MSVLVIFPSKALLVVFATDDGALLWSHSIVCQQMCFQILELFSTVSVWASILFVALVVK